MKGDDDSTQQDGLRDMIASLLKIREALTVAYNRNEQVLKDHPGTSGTPEYGDEIETSLEEDDFPCQDLTQLTYHHHTAPDVTAPYTKLTTQGKQACPTRSIVEGGYEGDTAGGGGSERCRRVYFM